MKRYLMSVAVFLMFVTSLFLTACGGNVDQTNGTDGVGEKQDGQEAICERIAQNLSTNNVAMAVEISEGLQQPLSSKEKKIVMQAMEKRINNKIKTFLTSFASNSGLVSKDTIEEIKQYKKIVTAVGISSSDYTNIDDYIEGILALEKYEKYDDLWSYYQYETSTWNEANTYWEYATSSYSDYTRDLYLNKALASFNDCVRGGKRYNQNSFGITEVINFAQHYVDKIEYFFSTGNDLSVDNYIVNAYSRTQTEFTEKSREFVDELEKLPTSVYYE